MILRLTNNRGFWNEKEVDFYGEDLKVELSHIESKKFNLVAKVLFESNEKFLYLPIKNDTFTLPADKIIVGGVKVEICVYLGSTLCKTIPCDRLIIKQIDTKVKIVPEIEELKETLQNQANEIASLNKKIETLTKILGASNGVKIDLGGAK